MQLIYYSMATNFVAELNPTSFHTPRCNVKPDFWGVLGTRFGSQEEKKIIIGSLQVHTGYLTFSLKKTG